MRPLRRTRSPARSPRRGRRSRPARRPLDERFRRRRRCRSLVVPALPPRRCHCRGCLRRCRARCRHCPAWMDGVAIEVGAVAAAVSAAARPSGPCASSLWALWAPSTLAGDRCLGFWSVFLSPPAVGNVSVYWVAAELPGGTTASAAAAAAAGGREQRGDRDRRQRESSPERLHLSMPPRRRQV